MTDQACPEPVHAMPISVSADSAPVDTEYPNLHPPDPHQTDPDYTHPEDIAPEDAARSPQSPECNDDDGSPVSFQSDPDLNHKKKSSHLFDSCSFNGCAADESRSGVSDSSNPFSIVCNTPAFRVVEKAVSSCRGALFDLDGTLLDSMPAWQNLAQSYLHSRGIDTFPAGMEQILQTMTTSESAVWMKETFGFPDTPDQIADQVNNLMDKNYRTCIPLKKEILPILQLLKEHHIPMAVVSTTRKDLCEAALERNGILEDFEFILSCVDEQMSKRNPAIFIKAAGMLETDAASTLVFEDALHAIQSAKAGGFPVCAIFDPASLSEWETIANTADFLWPPIIHNSENSDTKN